MDNGQLVPSKGMNIGHFAILNLSIASKFIVTKFSALSLLGTNFIGYHFKLEENLRSRVRAAAKKEAKKDVACK